ncbi:bifunctional diguanylate cyclase/phosphodiesterase [uncultured Pseudacidovorax sp.]|uniref:putative bifunctional diguanylate cyclase/phosphodiesterase n=1 Tax=uncultured Pseudacidovorax sp. TaxID=679313 RepID=UPI0025F2DB95|nr:GGDEF domain-containing phosphodiesterase [uncultured Pseudacidovorax sp.]
MSSLSVPAPAAPAEHLDAAELRSMVQHDQMVSVRQSVRAAIPINAVLTLAALLMAYSGDKLALGLLWALLSALVNVSRAVVCRLPYRLPHEPAPDAAAPSARWWRTRGVHWHLRLTSLLGLCSGLVWALVALLCDAYTSPQTLFYLTVVCGITAGSVTYGIAYARVPIMFITPALLSVAGCLLVAGGFDRQMLAVMVFVYLAALIRSAMQSEAAFKRGSLLKNEATVLADRLRQAHEASHAATRELEFRANHDPLTRLFNRDGFAEVARRRLEAAQEHEQCLLMLDLDGFKAINDMFGHGVGDRVLQDVGAWLGRELAPLGAVVGRWGGDEFVVLYDTSPAALSPEDVARLLTQRVAQASALEGGQLGVSVGLCVGRGLCVTDMLAFADEALYSAKRSGGDGFRFFDHGLQQALVVRRDVERDLGLGLDTGGIVLWYQPIFTAGGQLHSFEALLRWLHPRHGWVSPEQVVHAAAATGRARRLLAHVLTQVCEAARRLDAAGLAHLPLAVNVSPREMAHLEVDELVLETLRAHAVSPHRLQIEITEEVALNAENTHGKLARLAAAGVAISIDDFGVGYSSLASLRGEHVRQVKIDRSFISGLDGSRDNQLLVRTILQMARSLGIDAVAEGVERAEELMTLRTLECPLVQGYHLRRPAPLEEIIQQP